VESRADSSIGLSLPCPCTGASAKPSYPQNEPAPFGGRPALGGSCTGHFVPGWRYNRLDWCPSGVSRSTPALSRAPPAMPLDREARRVLCQTGVNRFAATITRASYPILTACFPSRTRATTARSRHSADSPPSRGPLGTGPSSRQMGRDRGHPPTCSCTGGTCRWRRYADLQRCGT